MVRNETSLLNRSKYKFCFNNLWFSAILFITFFSAHYTWADIYRYVDENGTIHFTNVPTDSRYKLYIYSGHPHTKYSDSQYDHIIREVSAKYGVDTDLVRAVIKAESDFNPFVISRKGARGLMQLMPETARDMKVKNVFNPRENIEGGVKYLRRLLNMFNNNLPLTLAAYNAGENAVKEYNYKIPPYKETRDYIRKVLYYLREYKNRKALKERYR
ncbi:MAG: lytic transglycosylase [Deltaproteobacteria bacterium]|nr:MAG: lytic transglycosylase [Deltaproteobacteria bacterium]